MLIYSKEQVRELCSRPTKCDTSVESIRDHCVVFTANWFLREYLKLSVKTTREYLRVKRDYPMIAIDEKTGTVYASNTSGIGTYGPLNYHRELHYLRG